MGKKLCGELAIELTRRCNLNCAHCLRGCGQNIDSNKQLIRKTLKSYEYITSLVLTGGEPTLVDELIKYTIDTIIELRISVCGVYIVTNGRKYSQRLINSMRKAYKYCEDPDMCGLCVSIDQYHGYYNEDAYYKYSAEPYYCEHKEHHDAKKDYFRIINEGNAQVNGIGTVNRVYRDYIPEEYTYLSDDGTLEYNDDIVYVSANGNVVFDCDLSYDHIDQYAAGNILEKSLYNIVKNNIR